MESVAEAQAVSVVTQLLDKLLDKYGNRLLDDEYMAKPEFAEIMEAARGVQDY